MSRYGRRNNDYTAPSFSSSSSRCRVKKNNQMTSNKIDLTTEMFPELSSNIQTTSNLSIKNNKPTSMSVWSSCSEPVKNGEDQDETRVNVITNIDNHDTKYWKGAKWCGPIFIRGNTTPIPIGLLQDSDKCRIEYSRDNIHWYSSWEKTFTKDQIERRKIETEQQEYEEECEEIYRIMNEYSLRIEEESDRYYREVGELDDYGKAVFAREQYEAYAKQFEMTSEIDSSEEDVYDEEECYLEEYY